MASKFNRRTFAFLLFACFISLIFIAGIITKLESSNCGFIQLKTDLFGNSFTDEENLSNLKLRLKHETDICHSVIKPPKLRPKNSTWTEFKSSGVESIFIHSAHYDDRVSGRDLPSIRLLATSSETSDNIFCQIWYSGFQGPYHSSAFVDSINNMGTFVKQFIINCELFATDPKPTHVSIVSGEKCTNASNIMEVALPIHQRREYQIGLCVIDTEHTEIEEHPYWLMEWRELYSLFGVEHMTFYNTSVLPNKVHGVINHYVLSGQAELISLTPQLSSNSQNKLRVIETSHVLMNDCLLRNQYRYEYIIMSGYSRIIIPTSKINYRVLMNNILEIAEEKVLSNSLVSFDQTALLLRKPSTTNLKDNLWIEHGIPISHKTVKHKDNQNPETFMVSPDVCLYIQDKQCVIADPKPLKSHTLLKDPTMQLPSDLAAVYSFYLDCEEVKHPNCVQVDKKEVIKHSIQEKRSLPLPLMAIIRDLRTRVKASHDMIRLDYDW